jgi:hypothetical protein
MAGAKKNNNQLKRWRQQCRKRQRLQQRQSSQAPRRRAARRQRGGRGGGCAAMVAARRRCGVGAGLEAATEAAWRWQWQRGGRRGGGSAAVVAAAVTAVTAWWRQPARQQRGQLGRSATLQAFGINGKRMRGVTPLSVYVHTHIVPTIYIQYTYSILINLPRVIYVKLWGKISLVCSKVPTPWIGKSTPDFFFTLFLAYFFQLP